MCTLETKFSGCSFRIRGVDSESPKGMRGLSFLSMAQLNLGHTGVASLWGSYGRFSRIRQVVPMCIPMTAYIGATRVHNQRQIDRFSHFCSAHGRVSSGMSWGMPGHVVSSNNCPFAQGSGPI